LLLKINHNGVDQYVHGWTVGHSALTLTCCGRNSRNVTALMIQS